MTLATKQLSLATLALLSVAAMANLAQSQTCADCAGTDFAALNVDSQYVEIGQPGGYFEQADTYAYQEIGGNGGCEQANTCGQQQTGRNRGGRISGLRSIFRALRPFGDSSGYEAYRSVFGGWAELEDEGGFLTLDGIESNDGFILGAAKGIYLNRNLRVERESSWRNNSSESISNSFGDTFGLDGRMNNFSEMVNVIREFRTGSQVRPYAGLGIGLSRQNGEFDVNGLADPVELELEDLAFAYQGIIGLRFVKSDRASLFAEYRYFANTETNLTQSVNGGPRMDISVFEYTSENIVFGLQFKL